MVSLIDGVKVAILRKLTLLNACHVQQFLFTAPLLFLMTTLAETALYAQLNTLY